MSAATDRLGSQALWCLLSVRQCHLECGGKVSHVGRIQNARSHDGSVCMPYIFNLPFTINKNPRDVSINLPYIHGSYMG